MEEFGSEVAGGGEDSRQAQPTTKKYLFKQGDLWEQLSGSSAQEIENVPNFDAKAPMK